MKDLTVLSQEIKGVTFPYRFMVAGGVVKTVEHAKRLVRQDVMFEWGSITTEPQRGNGGRDYYAEYVPDVFPRTLAATYNSIGLTNRGMEYVEAEGKDLIRMCDGQGIPSWINVSGNGVEDSLILLKRAINVGFKVITVNGACPNKKGQPILCDDPEATSEFFERAQHAVGNIDVVILWKVSAGMRRPMLLHNRTLFRKSRAITGVVTCNTVPNCLAFREDGSTAIETENGITRGGMAGPAIHAIALDHTEFMAEELPPWKIVIGCGGAGSPLSIANFIRAKAALVQTNSAFQEAKGDPDFIRDANLKIIDEFKGESVVKL